MKQLWYRDRKWQTLVLASSIALLTSVHWLVPRPDKQIHNLLYHFEVIPILMSGMLLGWRGAAIATVVTAAADFPLLWMLWKNDYVYLTDQAGEAAVFGIAGVVVGVIAERARFQNLRLQRTSRECVGEWRIAAEHGEAPPRRTHVRRRTTISESCS